MSVIVKDDSIQIERLNLGPFGTNSYLLICQKTGASVIVDAPGDAEKVLKRLEGTHPKYILMTHNHMDHVDALAALKSALNVPLAAHEDDAGGLPVKPEQFLNDGDTISFGEIQLKVLHTPGHTPGSLCFLTGSYLISGDTIFPGGPGKTWSPDDFKKIVESLRNKIFTLPDETQVYPGHGDATVLKKEKHEFEAFSSKPHDPDLCGDVVWLSS
ncbi:MAG: MBL fold metallo-hydrolase [Deltaproteobacteria bacterium]|nr:MBL fold metallo-hydrolase [Deltaproteobacteria bacterium]